MRCDLGVSLVLVSLALGDRVVVPVALGFQEPGGVREGLAEGVAISVAVAVG